MKLGSLFDGIGGWPLAATKFGIEPVWCSEIEKFPQEITKRHFPNMKHLGDITKIDGAKIEPVDIVTIGSPCQDLSIAGKRKGLAGERSGLFRTAIYIVRGMRNSTDGEYPRFVVWENVPGAFSSNKGHDFQSVLEEITESDIPMPKSGRWAHAGMVRSSKCDIAWRMFDAQYWGVPQRRKRIFLVADFGEKRAGEILFKPGSVCGYSAAGGSEREGTAGNTAFGVGGSVQCLTPWDVQSRRIFDAKGKWPALYGGEGGGKGYVAFTCEPVTFSVGNLVRGAADLKLGQGAKVHGIGWQEEIAPTLSAMDSGNKPAVAIWDMTRANKVMHPMKDDILPFDTTQITSPQNGCKPKYGDPCHPLCATAHVPAIVVSLRTVTKEPVTFSVGNLVRGVDAAPDNSGVCKTLRADMGDQHPCICLNDQGGQSINVGYEVRRLTPTECERLQGLPDGYTYGGSDSARYKALGNGMAQPCADFVIGRIAEVVMEGAS